VWKEGVVCFVLWVWGWFEVGEGVVRVGLERKESVKGEG
jgi:hypothetical protein